MDSPRWLPLESNPEVCIIDSTQQQKIKSFYRINSFSKHVNASLLMVSKESKSESRCCLYWKTNGLT